MTAPLTGIEIETHWRRLLSVVDEAATALVQASFSSAIRDFLDFACAIFDSNGKMLVQSTQSTPGLMGILPFVVPNIMSEFPQSELSPGDVLITNDPWLASGHLVDISVVTPVFFGDRIVAYIACAAHALNVGGRLATIESKNMYEEGLKIPVCKVMDRGQPQELVFEFLKWNVWEPDKVVGDLRAQIAANEVMVNGLLRFMREGKVDDLTPLAGEICDRSERSLRSAIRNWPNGRAASGVELSLPGLSEPVRLSLDLEILDDEIVLDYTGTADQVSLAVNVTLNMTRSYSFYILKCLLDPLVPNNEGCLRAVRIIAPEGSVLNAAKPAPTWGRTMIAHILPELVNESLSKLVPGHALADSGAAPLAYCNFVGEHYDGTPFFSIISFHGGMGASASGDGLSCISFPANCANIPAEIIENEAPILVRSKTLIPDSGGVGMHRGGLGQQVQIEVLDGTLGPKGPILAGVRGGRFNLPVKGLDGGGGSITPELSVNGVAIQGGRQIELRAGDVLNFTLPGGGGFGEATEREKSLVRNDLREGVVTEEAAEEQYGGLAG